MVEGRREIPMLRLLVMTCLLAALGGTTLSATTPGVPRVRAESRRVAAWIERGRADSATFRALLDRLERGDVIVYLAIDPGMRGGLAACVTWMAATPSARFVRASLRPDLPAREAVAMIAHELQHVLEVVEHPDVRSDGALAALYARIGHSTTAVGNRWDTVAALRTGDRVRLELLG
jgi:hypothetical protein